MNVKHTKYFAAVTHGHFSLKDRSCPYTFFLFLGGLPWPSQTLLSRLFNLLYQFPSPLESQMAKASAPVIWIPREAFADIIK